MTWQNIRTIKDDAENVAKYIFTKDDAVAEAVLYRYPTYTTRTVICCSTQSGCPVGCRFCGAGDHFVRSLTAEEIVSQIEYLLGDINCDVNDIERFQIMFMSMGEPMLNQVHLFPALMQLSELYPLAKLLVSTSGPRVDYVDFANLSRSTPNIGLQFSVHESTNEARDKLIPFKAKLTLEQIDLAGCYWGAITGRKPFFNYCAHEKNSFEEDADRLFELFNPNEWNATVSVICERNDGLPASSAHQQRLATDFAAKLLDRGFDVRVFDPAGQDTIGGGCGQLWYVQKWMQDNPTLTKKTGGSGKPKVHAPTGI